MKHALHFLLTALLLSSCSIAKHFAVPGPAQQQIVVNTESKDHEELLVTETFDIAEAQREELRADNTDRTQQRSRIAATSPRSPEMRSQPKDTLVVNDAITAEALDSERVARNARTWSIMPLLGLLFLPLILVGVIGTLVTISNYRKYTYVTERSQEDIRKARRNVLVNSVIVFLVLLIFIGLILGLAFLF